jgi:hypothetical protein
VPAFSVEDGRLSHHRRMVRRGRNQPRFGGPPLTMTNPSREASLRRIPARCCARMCPLPSASRRPKSRHSLACRARPLRYPCREATGELRAWRSGLAKAPRQWPRSMAQSAAETRPVRRRVGTGERDCRNTVASAKNERHWMTKVRMWANAGCRDPTSVADAGMKKTCGR